MALRNVWHKRLDCFSWFGLMIRLKELEGSKLGALSSCYTSQSLLSSPTPPSPPTFGLFSHLVSVFYVCFSFPFSVFHLLCFPVYYVCEFLLSFISSIWSVLIAFVHFCKSHFDIIHVFFYLILWLVNPSHLCTVFAVIWCCVVIIKTNQCWHA